MAYVKRKRIGGGEYFYLVESYRAQGKVKTRVLAYLGKSPRVPRNLAYKVGRPAPSRRPSVPWNPAALGAALTRKIMQGHVGHRGI